MNVKLITLSNLREFLNKFSKVATSGKYSDLSGVPTKLSQFTNDAGYAKTTDIPNVTTYTAGQGIKIENGVISIVDQIINTRIDITYTAPGYTLYSDYFLSNTITSYKNWNGACDMTETITVTKTITTTNTYLFSGDKASISTSTKTTTAKTLSKGELETLTAEQRKIYESGNWWYWTSTSSDGTYAWRVNGEGGFFNGNISDNDGHGGARLGFKNPFLK